MIHETAEYDASIFADLDGKSNIGYDPRNGVEWIADSTAATTRLILHPTCAGCCARAYHPTNNSQGHCVALRRHKVDPTPDDNRLPRSWFYRMHRLLWELYYAANGFPAQGGSIQGSGGVSNYGFYVTGVNGNWLTLYHEGGADPRKAPMQVRPHWVATFSGGTNFDRVLQPIVDDVVINASELPYFKVKLSCDVSALVTGSGTGLWPNDPAPWAMITLSEVPRVTYQYPLPFARMNVSPRTKLITSASGWNGLHPVYKYVQLTNNSGNLVRIAAPVRRASPDGWMSFRVEVFREGGWSDITTEIEAGGWERISQTHDNAGNVECRLWLGEYIPDGSGGCVEGDDLLQGASAVRVLYFVEDANGDYSMPPIVCGNMKRDLAAWVATAVTSGLTGVGVDGAGVHWYCAERKAANGIASFCAGRCGLKGYCTKFVQATPHEFNLAKAIAEIDSARWIVEEQRQVGLPDYDVKWFTGPSLLLLAGHYYDTNQQYHPYRVTRGNGSLGSWLDAEYGGLSIVRHWGGIYDFETELNGPPLDRDDMREGLFQFAGVTGAGASFVARRQNDVAFEDDESDPDGWHRHWLVRATPSFVRNAQSASEQYYNAARYGIEAVCGENAVVRAAPISTSPTSNLYVPAAVLATAGSEVECGFVVVRRLASPWYDVSGNAYTLQFVVTRPRITSLGAAPKRLGTADGQTASVHYTVGVVNNVATIDCAPAAHFIAYTGNASIEDQVVQFTGSGNVVELPDYLRLRSRYEAAVYRKSGDVLDKAWAGDAVEFLDGAHTAGLRFYVKAARAGFGTSWEGAALPPSEKWFEEIQDYLYLSGQPTQAWDDDPDHYLLRCDRIYLYDVANTLKHEIEQHGGLGGYRFRVYAGGVLQQSVAVVVNYAATEELRAGGEEKWQTWQEGTHLVVFRAAGVLYVRADAVPSDLLQGRPYCFKVSCGLLHGV